ncbi:leucine-rich repeat domain-containing protein [Thalassotalea psychrophila]|uniref:Leucine-rich repeat domain-containing protein n=1 Tax=Thalassotalea psychrophila TaxID=3065647 RepID=A0ABY9TYE5_9GAMM|nr:leucine-rich repeat domain-containing protein [Colwelliaceae bacterium SQ149]
MKSNFELTKLLYTGVIATSMTLAGCGGGGGGGSDVATPDNMAPTVSIFGADRGTERSDITLQANAEDIDGTIASYAWTVSDTAINLTGANSKDVTFTTPSVEQETTFTMTVTVTDDDGAQATRTLDITSEPIYNSLTITGKVVDKPLEYIDVVLSIGDLEFTTDTGKTNSTGDYFIDMEVEERYFDQLVKITATGNAEKHTGVKLVSVLGSFNTLQEKAGRDEYLVKGEHFAVNVTNFSTAQYILAEALEPDSNISTQQQLNDAIASIEYQDVANLAASIKLIVDNEEYNLPAGSKDTFAFASNSEVVATFNNQLPQDVLNTAYEDTVRNEDLVEFPDWDLDGIPDHEDDNIDGDNVAGDLDNDSGNADGIIDYYPKDHQLYAPTVGMIKDKFYLSETKYSDNKVNHIYNSLNQNMYALNIERDKNGEERLPLDDTSVLEFTKLAFSNILSIQGIEYFTNVTDLEVNVADIDDISYLASLTKLTRLHINGVSATDFSALGSLKSLTDLNVANTTGFALSTLSNANALTKLNVSNTAISEITALQGLTNVQELDASNNSITDASLLSALTQLTSLNLANNAISVLPDFSLLTNITQISLNNNKLGSNGNSIDSLQYLTNIGNSLDLSNNEISDPAPIASLSQLTELNLAANNISDASSLTALSNLTKLILSNNNATSINSSEETLGYAATMQELYLANNNFATMPDFSAFKALQTLDLAKNELTELTNFTMLMSNVTETEPTPAPTLDKLNLSFNSLTSVNPLDSWSSLPVDLIISNNPTISCDAASSVLIANAETFGINLSLDDLNTYDEETGAIISECIVIEDPSIPETISELSMDRIGMFNITGEQSRGSSHGKTGRTYNGQWEADRCLFSGDMIAPICWTGLSNSKYCDGVEGEYMYTCNTQAAYFELYPPLTIDMKYGRQADGKFVSSFEGRSLLNVLSIHPDERTITCIFDAEIQQSTCTLTSPLVQGPAITWQQDHTFKVAPQCRGIEGGHVARCTPAADIIVNDAAPDEDNAFSFDLDLSTFTFIDREVEEEEECDRSVELCRG